MHKSIAGMQVEDAVAKVHCMEAMMSCNCFAEGRYLGTSSMQA
jgi:hypothetical protein